MNEYREYNVGDVKNKPRYPKWWAIIAVMLAIQLVFLGINLLFIIPAIKTNNGVDSAKYPVTSNVSDSSNEGQVLTSVSVVDIAKSVNPSVVGVLSTQKSSRGTGSGSDEIFDSQYFGSGFVVSEDGHIVTNYHVIEGGTVFSVILPGGETVDAELVGSDPSIDIAVLKVSGDQDLPVAQIGDSSTVEVGEVAVAIGNPLGIEFSGTVTSGIISATQRSMLVGESYINMLQTDAAINPGNSGGPLVNSSGQVIGINTQKASVAGVDEFGQTISAEGIGFAIPINEAKPIIEQIINGTEIVRPGIGVSCYEIDDELAAANQVPRGIYVDEVNVLGSAYSAGIRAGDIITKIDNKAIVDMNDFTERLRANDVGDKISVTIWRDGSETTITVTLMDINDLE